MEVKEILKKYGVKEKLNHVEYANLVVDLDKEINNQAIKRTIELGKIIGGRK